MLYQFGTAFIAVFVALDVIGVLPVFVSMTFRMSSEDRSRIIDQSMIVAFTVALAFVLIGESLFHFLGITLPDFKIAGGLVLLLVSLTDLVGGPEKLNQSSGSTGVVPLAVPFITGPGVITSLALQIHSVGYWVTIAALVANYFIAWIVLHRSEKVTGFIGKDGTIVISKIVALLLAAISVSIIRTGVFELIAEFKATY